MSKYGGPLQSFLRFLERVLFGFAPPPRDIFTEELEKGPYYKRVVGDERLKVDNHAQESL